MATRMRRPLFMGVREERLTTELSDSRPAVITSVALDNQSAPPKPATLELQSGAAVRSSDLVGR